MAALSRRREMMTLLAAVILSITSAVVAMDYQDAKDLNVAAGRDQYNVILRHSSLPRFGQCWKRALSALESGCKDLNEDNQHELAFQFMNCFLERAGREQVPCESGSCPEKLDMATLQIYNDYFIHTNNMCSFLQLQVWNEETSLTIDRLASSSNQVAEQLTESSHITLQMLKQQESSLQNQENLNDAIASSSQNVDRMFDVFSESSDKVHRMFDDYRRTTKQQQLMIGEVFDKITNLQSMVLGEFAGFYSLLFHALSILIGYLLTSTSRTSSARFWLFALSVINIGVERMIVHWYTNAPSADNDALYADFWLARKLFWLAALMILVKCALNYKDLNVINNNLLVEITRQNAEIRRFVRTEVKHNKRTVLKYDETINDTTWEQTSIIDNTALENTTAGYLDNGHASCDRTYLVTPGRLIGPNESLILDELRGDSLLDVTQEVTQMTTRYHLRQRPQSPSWNPILSEESPEDFMKKMRRISGSVQWS